MIGQDRPDVALLLQEGRIGLVNPTICGPDIGPEFRDLENRGRQHERESLPRDFPPNLIGRFIFSQPDVNRVTQEAVRSPGQIGDLSHKRRLDPVHPRENEGDPKRVLRGGRTFRGEVLRASGSKRRRRSARTLRGIPVPTRPA